MLFLKYELLNFYILLYFFNVTNSVIKVKLNFFCYYERINFYNEHFMECIKLIGSNSDMNNSTKKRYLIV